MNHISLVIRGDISGVEYDDTVPLTKYLIFARINYLAKTCDEFELSPLWKGQGSHQLGETILFCKFGGGVGGGVGAKVSCCYLKKPSLCLCL